MDLLGLGFQLVDSRSVLGLDVRQSNSGHWLGAFCYTLVSLVEC